MKEHLADYLELSLPSKAHHVVQCKVYVLQRVGTCSNLLWCALNRLYLFHYRLFVCCCENCHEKRVSDDVVIARDMQRGACWPKKAVLMWHLFRNGMYQIFGYVNSSKRALVV